jgi:hypothetical protein
MKGYKQHDGAKAEIAAVSTAQSQSSMHVGPIVAALASTVIP